MYKVTPEWGVEANNNHTYFKITHLKCGTSVNLIFRDGPIPAKVGCTKCHEAIRFYVMAKIKEYIHIHKIANLPI